MTASTDPATTMDSTATGAIDRIIARSRVEPALGWAAVSELVAGIVRDRCTSFPTPAVTAFAQVDQDPAHWYLDAEPTRGGAVVLFDRGAGRWRVHAVDDVEINTVPLPRGMAVWGGHTARVPSDAHPLASLADSRSECEPAISAFAGLAMGAHALGVAARFRDAFVRKAATSSRGWSAAKTIDDPMVLKAMLDGDGRLDGATASLWRRFTEHSGSDGGQDDLARLSAIAALDAAFETTTALMAFSGASALYDPSPFQQSLAHLAALTTHPLFTRAERLRVSRAALEQDIARLCAPRSVR